jgi:hypothetical protein
VISSRSEVKISSFRRRRGGELRSKQENFDLPSTNRMRLWARTEPVTLLHSNPGVTGVAQPA